MNSGIRICLGALRKSTAANPTYETVYHRWYIGANRRIDVSTLMIFCNAYKQGVVGLPNITLFVNVSNTFDVRINIKNKIQMELITFFEVS